MIEKPEYLTISGEAWLAGEIKNVVATMAKHKKGAPLARKLKIFELLKAYNNPNNQRPGRELLVELSVDIPGLLQLDLNLRIPSPEEKRCWCLQNSGSLLI